MFPNTDCIVSLLFGDPPTADRIDTPACFALRPWPLTRGSATVAGALSDAMRDLIVDRVEQPL